MNNENIQLLAQALKTDLSAHEMSILRGIKKKVLSPCFQNMTIGELRDAIDLTKQIKVKPTEV